MRESVKGFTLVEMLLALALMALLAVAVLKVVASLGRTVIASTKEQNDSPNQQIANLLRRDLLAARMMHVEPDSITLTGYGAIDPVTKQLTLLPAEVRYEITPLGKISCLTRWQRQNANPSSKSTCTDLIAMGVTALNIESTQPASQRLIGKQQVDHVPPSVKVTLGFADHSQWQQMLVLR